jgi:polar amino acid transport system substrate-binding protein
MKKIIALLLVAVISLFSFAGCGEKVVVAEKGSAGEKVASNLDGYEYTAVDSQNKALMEVKAGTADAAIVDYVLSIGSIGEGTDFADLKVDGDGYAPESYGIAFRKGSDITAKVNEAIKELKDTGKLANIAKKYKLQDLITADESFDAFKQAEKDSDWEYIKNKGELIIGITYFAPMNYLDAEGKLIGFETEFATAVCEAIGVKAKFVVINWNSKEAELKAKSIDCIWNGMTIDDDRKATMSITIPYMENKQVMVTKK